MADNDPHDGEADVEGRAERVGPWRLIEFIGSGGMGQVWRAEGPGGTAAVKLTPVTGAARRRFEREVRVAMALSHPHIVRTLDFGQADDGRLYLAMELLSGEPLADRVDRGPMAPAEVARIGCEAAAALGAVHAQGYVHRDVKPGNLFLCSDGRLKLLDFGLAVPIVDDRVLGETHVTQPGRIVGTVSYMAPEQARGEYEEDARSDVWALGAVLHHAVTGRPPFGTGGGIVQLMRIATEAPDPLPDSVPAWLRAAIGRALDKDPKRRPPTMAAFADALAQGAGEPSHWSGAPIAAAPVGPGEVRLVAVVLGEGVGDHAAFAAAVRRWDGEPTALRSGLAVGVFGGAEWLGDEPERAVRAALGARERSIATRLGVGTNKVVWTGVQRAPTGAAVESAAVALSQMEAGQVGTDPETRRRIAGGFMVDGATVVGERTGARVLGVREVGGVEVPMLGREGELRLLADAYERTVAESRSRAVVVLGPPGIGKSRLRYEFLRWLAGRPEGAVHLEARGESHRLHSPLSAMVGALRARAGLPEGVPAEDGRARVRALVAAAKLPLDRVQGTEEFLGEILGAPFFETLPLRTARADANVMRDRIRLAVGDLLDGLTLKGPVVIVVEDAHWADALTLDYLEFLRGRLHDRPLLVVAMARAEMLAERPDALPGAERVELRDLAASDMAALVERILGNPEPAVVERASGNPYFAEELALARREGAALDALPLTVEGAVQARLDQLPAAEKELLKRAAILGRRFWTEALSAMGQTDAPRLVGSLRRRDLVVPQPERLSGCHEWLFRHAVLWEVARGMLTEAQARELHGRAAAWLASRSEAAPEDVASHYESAGDSASAQPFWVRAAERADGRGESARVLDFSSRALSRPLADDVAYGLRLRCATCLDWLGRWAEAERELDRAEESSRGVRLTVRAEARGLGSRIAGRCGRHDQEGLRADEALSLARQASERGEPEGPALEVRTNASWAERLAFAGRLDEARVVLAHAEAKARGVDDETAKGWLARSQGLVAWARGDLVGALRHVRESLLRSRARGDVRQAVVDAGNVGAHLHPLGAFVEARTHVQAALSEARRLGLRATEAAGLENLGLVLHRLGETAAGLEALDAAIVIAREINHTWELVASLVYRALVLAEAGHAQAALQAADAALAEPSIGAAEPSGRVARALALLGCGRAAEALAECDRTIALRDAKGGMAEFEIELLLCRHDALEALCCSAEAQAALGEAQRVFSAQHARIDDPAYRRTFAQNIPAHARLLAPANPAS